MNHPLPSVTAKKNFDDLTKASGLESLAAELGYKTSSYTQDVLDTLLSNDPAILTIKKKVLKLSKSNISVLILGETGTGKELIATALHGDRKMDKFVDLNCGAIPSELLESELFGVTKGAFTGSEARPGLLEQCNGGTLFLDEIGDMPRLLQCKLLRVLQTKTYKRVGGVEPRKVDFKLVSATNHMDLLSKDDFRKDLYYRLAGFVIKLPSLRERDSMDIELIVNKYSSSPASAKHILDTIKDHKFLGNVRELLNIIEEFNILSE